MRVVTVKAERSVSVRADPDRVWQLLQNPAIWSLKAKAFMFAVPGADRLCLWVGSTALGLPDNGLYEVAADDSARSVTPSTLYSFLAERAGYLRLCACTPVGQAGEMQYFVDRLEGGALQSQAIAVSAVTDGLGAVAH